MLITSIIIKLRSATKFKYAMAVERGKRGGKRRGCKGAFLGVTLFTRFCMTFIHVHAIYVRECLAWICVVCLESYEEKQAFHMQSQCRTCPIHFPPPFSPPLVSTISPCPLTPVGSACKLMRHLFIMP